MRVKELMTSPAVTCSPQDSLAHAAHLLWQNDCGVLPVVDHNGRLGSVVTDRDICMAAYTSGKSLEQLRVADCMAREAVACREDDDVGAASRLMQRHTVRRLPVLDRADNLVGLLSLNDLALSSDKEAALGKEVVKIMVAVCKHRGPETEQETDRAATPERSGKEPNRSRPAQI